MDVSSKSFAREIGIDEKYFEPEYYLPINSSYYKSGDGHARIPENYKQGYGQEQEHVAFAFDALSRFPEDDQAKFLKSFKLHKKLRDSIGDEGRGSSSELTILEHLEYGMESYLIEKEMIMKEKGSSKHHPSMAHSAVQIFQNDYLYEKLPEKYPQSFKRDSLKKISLDDMDDMGDHYR